jgi:hypothetical protein
MKAARAFVFGKKEASSTGTTAIDDTDPETYAVSLSNALHFVGVDIDGIRASMRGNTTGIVTSLVAYVNCGNTYSRLAKRVADKGAGKDIMDGLKSNQIKESSGSDPAVLTLSRIAIAHLPVLYGLRLTLKRADKLPSSGVPIGSQDPAICDVAFSGLSLDTAPFNLALSFQDSMGVVLTKGDRSGSRKKLTDEEALALVKQYRNAASSAQKADPIMKAINWAQITDLRSGLQAMGFAYALQ